MLTDRRIKEAQDNLKAYLQHEALVGIKADEIIQSFDYERKKRSVFQYETSEEAKQEKAKVSLESAKEFINELKKLVANR